MPSIKTGLICVFVFFLSLGGINGVQARAEEVFYIRTLRNPEPKRPWLAQGEIQRAFLRLTHDTLFIHGPRGGLEPALAKDCVFSPDGLAVKIILRKNVRFSDGSLMTARQVKKALDRYALQESQQAENCLPEFIKEVKALDRFTVLVRFKCLVHSVKQLLTDERVSPCSSVLTSKFSGAGPYMIAKRTKKGELHLKANPHYWGAPPEPGNLAFWVGPGKARRVKGFDPKKIDLFLGLPSLGATWPFAFGDVRIKPFSAGRCLVLAFNQRHDAWRPKKARKAFGLALDLEKIRQKAGPWGETASAFHEKSDQVFNPQKARLLLKNAGFKPGQAIRLVVSKYDALGSCLLKELACQLEKVGLRLLVNRVSEAKMKRMIFESDWPNQPDLFLFSCKSQKNGNTPDCVYNLLNLGGASFQDGRGKARLCLSLKIACAVKNRIYLNQWLSYMERLVWQEMCGIKILQYKPSLAVRSNAENTLFGLVFRLCEIKPPGSKRGLVQGRYKRKLDGG
jgi:ABC-type transport system substrate-binding protein